MKRINYIAAFHFGDRMNTLYTKALRENKFYIFEEHLHAITQYHSGIDKVTFVFNLDHFQDEKSILEQVSSYNIPFPYETVFRQNKGACYGAWADIILRNLSDFEYFFVASDDYIPCANKFFEPFIERCKNEYAYICMFGEKIPPPGMIYHASIPEGIISGDACRQVLKNQGKLFEVFDQDNTYDLFYKTQEMYCKYFVKEGFKVGDITDSYCSPFMVTPTRSIKIFGDSKNPVIFKPIPIPG